VDGFHPLNMGYDSNSEQTQVTDSWLICANMWVD
jgi:hypothetical protein